MTARLGLAAVLLCACNEPPPKQPDTSADKTAESNEQRPPAKVVVAKGLGAQLVKAQRESACVQAMQIRSAVEMYRVSNRDCPSSIQALVDGKFLRELPKDPWKSEYAVACDGDTVSVTSPGPDAKPGSEDDVVQDGTNDGCK